MSDVLTDQLDPDAADVPMEGVAHVSAPATVRYGGFWIRAAAYVIDVLILSPVSFVLTFLQQFSPASNWQAAETLVVITALLAYNILLVARPAQATWGKQVLGLRIVRTDGKPIGYRLALGRFLSRSISMFCLLIGVLMVGWTREKRGLHDMMCRTRVVYR